MDWKDSVTKENLLRAFAGESQARNRYTFAAETAKEKNLQVVQAVFLYTANQELAHGKVFYDLLKKAGCENVVIQDAGYPVDLADDPAKLLKLAQEHELEEYSDVYPAFADKAEEEGFREAAAKFRQIAAIEKVHADRFGRLAKQLEEGKLFVSSVDTGWLCLNCGHVLSGKQAPAKCPVCGHDQGYFVRFEFSPYEH
jgi:rubrerythrin